MKTFRDSDLRVGAFRYLNSLPMLCGFVGDRGAALPGAPPVRWGTPVDCARWLACEEVDAALIPSIEYARGDLLTLVPGVAISTDREVRSVVVLSREPLERCTSIALDATSRTSVALLQVLLARRFRCSPDLEVMPPDPEAMLARHDAALLIADGALLAETRDLRVYDLAAEWNALTGLPFVFAVWALRPQAAARVTPSHLARFQAPLSLDANDLAAMAEREAPRLGIDVDEARTYLQQNLRYRLGERECQALETFFHMASEEGLAPDAALRLLPAGSVDAQVIS